MRTFLHKIFGHNYSKPIASQYVSFHSRDIIYECKCGKRIMRRIRREYGDPFPIQTNNHISDKEMENILNNEADQGTKAGLNQTSSFGK